MGKRFALVFVGLAVVSAISYGGWRWTTEWRWQETTDDAYLRSDITAISPKVGGHIAAVEVVDNQFVHKGDVLVRIDDRDYRAKVDEARALVAARQATLLNLDARLDLQRAQIAAAEAQTGSAAAELTRSHADLARSESLMREEIVSRQLLDTHRADALKANAGLRGAQAGADAARRQLVVLDSERAMDAAQLEQAKAQLAAAELDLEHTVVTAPVDGIVGNRGAQTGLFVRTGTPLMAVVPVDVVWAESNFKETQVGRLTPGLHADVTVDAYPGVVLHGRVDSAAPASGADFSLLPPDNATGNFTKVVQRIPVKIVFDRGHPLEGKLRPGMSVVVTVNTHSDSAQGAPPQTVAGNR